MSDSRTPNPYDRPEPNRPSGADATAAHTIGDGDTTREQVLQREKEQFGGMKFGSAFFGWLTATGTAVILTALLAATGTAIGLGNQVDPNQAADAAADNAATVGIVGGVVLAVILLGDHHRCGPRDRHCDRGRPVQHPGEFEQLPPHPDQ